MSRGFEAVAAMAENHVIGQAGRLPWELPEDLAWFKQLTQGHAVIMGRKTFASIGRALPRRQNIVLSRSGAEYPGVTAVGSLDEAEAAIEPGCRAFVIGGAEIYALALPRTARLYITHVFGTYPGDTFFPAFEDAFSPAEVIRDTGCFRIIRYERNANPPST